MVSLAGYSSVAAAVQQDSALIYGPSTRVLVADDVHVYASALLEARSNLLVGRSITANSSLANTVLGNGVTIQDGVSGNVSIGVTNVNLSESNIVQLAQCLHADSRLLRLGPNGARDTVQVTSSSTKIAQALQIAQPSSAAGTSWFITLTPSQSTVGVYDLRFAPSQGLGAKVLIDALSTNSLDVASIVAASAQFDSVRISGVIDTLKAVDMTAQHLVVTTAEIANITIQGVSTSDMLCATLRCTGAAQFDKSVTMEGQGGITALGRRLLCASVQASGAILTGTIDASSAALLGKTASFTGQVQADSLSITNQVACKQVSAQSIVLSSSLQVAGAGGAISSQTVSGVDLKASASIVCQQGTALAVAIQNGVVSCTALSCTSQISAASAGVSGQLTTKTCLVTDRLSCDSLSVTGTGGASIQGPGVCKSSLDVTGALQCLSDVRISGSLNCKSVNVEGQLVCNADVILQGQHLFSALGFSVKCASIESSGNSAVAQDLSVGKNLTVSSESHLNSLDVAGTCHLQQGLVLHGSSPLQCSIIQSSTGTFGSLTTSQIAAFQATTMSSCSVTGNHVVGGSLSCASLGCTGTSSLKQVECEHLVVSGSMLVTAANTNVKALATTTLSAQDVSTQTFTSSDTATFNGTLRVSGQTVCNSVVINAAMVSYSTIELKTGALICRKDVEVDGTATCANLTTTGQCQMNGLAVTGADGVHVSSATNLNTLDATGHVVCYSDVDIHGVTNRVSLNSSGLATCASGLYVAQSADTLQHGVELYVGGSVQVDGATRVNSLIADSGVQCNAGIDTQGLTETDRLYVRGTASFNSGADVVGQVTSTYGSDTSAQATLSLESCMTVLCLVSTQTNVPIGSVLAATGAFSSVMRTGAASTIATSTHAIPVAELASSTNASAVIGVVVASEGTNQTRKFEYGPVSANMPYDSKRYSVATHGFGQVLVNSENGDIVLGDYLCPSTVAGQARRQTQDEDPLSNLQRSDTVAKAMQSITFTGASMLIACKFV